MNFFGKRVPKENPWAEGASNTYIGQFREELGQLHAELTQRFGKLYYRFVRDTKRVEFYEASGALAAHIRVEGCTCSPTTAKIGIDTLPTESRLFFMEAFPTLSVRFV